MLQARWRLFGHVLRREPSIESYGLPTKLWHSISTTMPSEPSQKDLETIRKIAKRRQEWTTFTADIKKAAEAERSDDTPSGRP